MNQVKKKHGRPPRAAEITEKEIAKSLRNNGGFVTYTAEELKCYASNISMRISRSEYLQRVLEEIKEEKLDFAESKLFENIDRNEFQSIRFYLKYKGKSRGYQDPKNKISISTSISKDCLIDEETDAKEAANLYINLINNAEIA